MVQHKSAVGVRNLGCVHTCNWIGSAMHSVCLLTIGCIYVHRKDGNVGKKKIGVAGLNIRVYFFFVLFGSRAWSSRYGDRIFK